jgi:hypothetical protein
LKAASSRPYSASVASIIARTSDSLATSARTNSPWEPASRTSRTVSPPSALRRPATTTFAPSRARATAAARPIPDVPPATSATLPVNDPMMSLRIESYRSINVTHFAHSESSGRLDLVR